MRFNNATISSPLSSSLLSGCYLLPPFSFDSPGTFSCPDSTSSSHNWVGHSSVFRMHRRPGLSSFLVSSREAFVRWTCSGEVALESATTGSAVKTTLKETIYRVARVTICQRLFQGMRTCFFLFRGSLYVPVSSLHCLRRCLRLRDRKI